MNVRAKFTVHEKAARADGSATIRMSPVYGEENRPWSKYTPSGSIEMNITNPPAAALFEPGKAYFVDFTEADEPAK
jgi:hypothetical protein